MNLNLNADLGESFGAWRMGDDEALLALVGAANIACGFHAGDPLGIRRTVRAARDAGVELGAHPSYPDLQGFGRRAMQLGADELEAGLVYQIAALAGIAAVEGGRLSHVKPHGALNNQACEDEALAGSVVRAILAFDPGLILLAPACSALAAVGERAGLRVALEVFADRTYTETGALRPRTQPGAVLTEAAQMGAHVQAMLAAGGLVTPSGRVLPTPIHSVCVHGDTPGAVAHARHLRAALAADGVRWQGLRAVLGAAR